MVSIPVGGPSDREAVFNLQSLPSRKTCICHMTPRASNMLGKTNHAWGFPERAPDKSQATFGTPSAKFAGHAHYVQCAPKHPKTSEQSGMQARCYNQAFAPPHPNSGCVSSIWVYPGRTGDLREWVPEVEVTKRLTFHVIRWVMVTFVK